MPAAALQLAERLKRQRTRRPPAHGPERAPSSCHRSSDRINTKSEQADLLFGSLALPQCHGLERILAHAQLRLELGVAQVKLLLRWGMV